MSANRRVVIWTRWRTRRSALRIGAAWLRTLRSKALPVADPHTVISNYLMSVRAAKRGKRIGEVPAGEPKRIGGTRKLQVIRWGAAYYFQFWKERFCA